MSRTDIPRMPRRLVQGGDGGPWSAEIASLLAASAEPIPPAAHGDQVFRQVVADMRPSGRRRVWLALPAVAVAAVVLLVLFVHRGGPQVAGPRVASTTGSIWMGTAAQPSQEVEIGTLLAPDTRLRTGSESRAVIHVAPVAEVVAEVIIDENSQAAFAATASGAEVQLDRGAVVASARVLPVAEAPVVVRVQDYQVRVLGSAVSVRAAAYVAVEVVAGTALVSGNARGNAVDLRVSAGQCWSSQTGRVGPCSATSASAPVLDPGSERSAEDPAASPAHVPSSVPESLPGPSGPAVSDAVSDAVSNAFGVLGEHEGAGAAREASREPPPKASRPASRPVSRPAAGPRPRAAAERQQVTSAPPVPSAAPTRYERAQRQQVTSAPPVPPAVPTRYERAIALADAGRYRDAAILLEQIARQRLPQAELALYEAAHIKYRHLGDAAGALALFRTYRSRYPRGRLGQEVALSIIELEFAQGHNGQALAEIEAFLAHYRDSERRAELLLRKGDVLRERGDCGRALALYDQARAAARTPRVEQDALYFAAVCALAQERVDDARQRLTDYVREFPQGRHATAVRRSLAALKAP